MHVSLEGFNEHTKRRAQDINGEGRGAWKCLEDYRIIANSLKQQLKPARIGELMLHVNDIPFTDACVEAFVESAKQ